LLKADVIGLGETDVFRTFDDLDVRKLLVESLHTTLRRRVVDNYDFERDVSRIHIDAGDTLAQVVQRVPVHEDD
jgi:hypothetical protein